MRKSLLFLAAAVLVLQGGAAAAQGHITTPKEALGHELGEDYFLATYSQLESYWKTLASQSDRAKLVEIGKTAEGRPQYMMIVSSPQNMRQLEKYRDISRRLAKAEGLTPDQAHALLRLIQHLDTMPRLSRLSRRMIIQKHLFAAPRVARRIQS